MLAILQQSPIGGNRSYVNSRPAGAYLLGRSTAARQYACCSLGNRPPVRPEQLHQPFQRKRLEETAAAEQRTRLHV